MPKKIIIWTTKFCPWCDKLKEFFQENNIKYLEKDITKDYKAAKEMIEKSGQQGVPVIEIDNKIIIGFDKEKIKELLNLKKDI